MDKKYRPIIKKGTHLASSKKTDGTYLGALLDNDTNKVVGQAEGEEIKETKIIEENDEGDFDYHYEDYNTIGKV